MSRRRPPEYARSSEFGRSIKPKEFLKGFLPKGISHKIEVDYRKALLRDEGTSTLTSPMTTGGVATTDGGTIYSSWTSKSIKLTGKFEPSTWSTGLTSLSTGSRAWSWKPDTLPADLSDEEHQMVVDAICEQVATHPIPARPYTWVYSPSTTSTTTWSSYDVGTVIYDEK